MWEVFKRASNKVRGSISYFLAAMIAVFLCLGTFQQPAYAADASWNNDTILYAGHQYYGPVLAKKRDSTGLIPATTYYTFIPTDSNGKPGNKAFVIYFAPGLDPGKENAASYAEYDLSNGRTFSNQRNVIAITLNPQGQASSTESSCSVTGGLGWIICPVTTFLASGMDWVYKTISSFMDVQPLNVDVSSPKNSLYLAWGYMRNLANIAFVIAFMIIIYSYLTSAGISNYNLKKMLPRLIIAAILVNLSYYLCALAVDISNTLGASIAKMFTDLRHQIFHIDNDTWNGGSDLLSWESLSGAILGGSVATLGAAIGIGSVIAATGGSIAGLIFLLLPSLLGLFLTALVVLLILGARQAIITIFVVISPLAFVAYLLPNTEKFFDKWRGTLTTMLIFYPAFSVIFGGAQLAGSIIVQNANSILMVVLGMITMVAPLVITPLILKFSGGLLGKVAGFMNNPKKGLLDRTRNWSKDRTELQKYNALGNTSRYNSALNRTARRMEYNKAQQKRRLELYKQRFDNYSAHRRTTHARDQATEIEIATAKAQGKLIEDRFALGITEMKAGRTDTIMALRQETQLSRVDNFRENINARLRRNTIGSITNRALQNSIDLDIESRITASAKSSAEIIQIQEFANQLRDNGDLRIRAGGIDHNNGPIRAHANAIAAIDKIRKDAIGNTKIILRDLNLDRDATIEVANGTSTLIQNTAETRAAAIENIFGSKDKGSIAQAYKEVDFSFPGMSDDDRSRLQIITAEAMMSGARPAWVGGGTIANLKQGDDYTGSSAFMGAYGNTGVYEQIYQAIHKQKIDTDELASMGTDFLAQVQNALADTSSRSMATISDDSMVRFVNDMVEALTNPDYYTKLGDSKPKIIALLKSEGPRYRSLLRLEDQVKLDDTLSKI